MTEDSPLTVAGAAEALGDSSPVPRSLLIPEWGTVDANDKRPFTASQIGVSDMPNYEALISVGVESAGYPRSPRAT